MAIKSVQERQDAIESHFSQIMELLGLNLKDPSLKNTPKRVAKMYVQETCSSLFREPPVITMFPNKKERGQIVLVRDISINSICEHHFVPFIGKCAIAYIPGKKIAGLSKFNRVAQYFAEKPQVQERLGDEILNHLVEKLGTKDVAVLLEAKHFCVCTRGIKDPNSNTITSHLSGVFFESIPARQEFFNLLKI